MSFALRPLPPLPIRDLRAGRDRIADALVAVGVAERIVAGECPIALLPETARRGGARGRAGGARAGAGPHRGGGADGGGAEGGSGRRG